MVTWKVEGAVLVGCVVVIHPDGPFPSDTVVVNWPLRPLIITVWVIAADVVLANVSGMEAGVTEKLPVLPVVNVTGIAVALVVPACVKVIEPVVPDATPELTRVTVTD